MLSCVIAGILPVVIDGVAFPDSGSSPLNSLSNLGTPLPSPAIGARRLHDIDRTGGWQPIGLTVIGLIVMIDWWVQPGREGPNRFGGPAPTTA